MPIEHPTSIRLPSEVKRDFKRLAKRNRRSISREIVNVLVDWLKQNPVPKRGETEAAAVEETE